MAKNNLYYTLLLTQTSAVISLVEIKGGTSKILKKNHLYFTSLEDLEEELRNSVFKQKEANQIILFLNHSYLDLKTNSLKTEYKEIFTKLFKNSSLTALGYIETYEATVNYLSKQQDFPLNALILEVEKNSLSASLAKGGKIEISKTTSLSSNLKESIISLLEEINKKPFPAKIYLLNFDEENEQIENLTKEKWPKELFLHHPEIKILSIEKINSNLIKTFTEEIFKGEREELEEKKEEVLPLGFSENEESLEKETEKKLSLPKISFSLSFPSFPKLQFPNFPKKLFPLVFSLLLIPGIILLHETFLHKAQLKIYPETKTFEIKDSIPFNPNSNFFEMKTKEVKLKKTFSATGEKQIGKKASGKIKLYNFSNKELLVNPKTKIIYNKKVYYPKESVTVPPAKEETSGDLIIKKPGTKIIEVEAEKIGEDYNLSTSSKLRIGSLDEDLYFAKLEGKISGGTSENVKTISKEDLEKARKEIKKIVLDKIKPNDLVEDSNQYLPLKQLANAKIIKENFDKELGDIADEFSLEAKVKVEYPFLKKDALIKNYEDKIIEQIGENYKYDLKKTKVKATVDKENNQIEILISGKATKEIDLKRVKNELKFKPINSLPPLKGIEKIEVLQNTAVLPFFSHRLPYKSENIQVKLEY